MPRFILHVGPHKTGTSYLQEAFVRTRPLLAGRGVLYPATWGRIAHHGLPELLRSGADARLARQFAELGMAGYPTVLISVEGLATLPRAAIERLRALIGPDNPVRVVFYARSWADRLPSHWKQATREGGTQSLPEYLYQRVAQPSGSLLVNFGAGLRACAEVFGPEALAVSSPMITSSPNGATCSRISPRPSSTGRTRPRSTCRRSTSRRAPPRPR